ncbi:hypothetical protein HDV00_010810 [Rhizophlyctis rosea]|nr:hypothetical protein HDV00_010810 [Rhizophlyctis rosea]
MYSTNSNPPDPVWSPPPIQAPKPQHPVSPHRVGAASPPAPYNNAPQTYSNPQTNYGQQSANYGQQTYPSAGSSMYSSSNPPTSFSNTQQYPSSNFGASSQVGFGRPAPGPNVRPQAGGGFNNQVNSGFGGNTGPQFATTGQMGGQQGGGMGMGGMGGGGGAMGGNQPHGVPTFFGQEFINEFQGNAATQLGMQLGTKAFAQVQENVNQNLNRWVNIPQLKYYFNVSNSYVLHKIALLLFPFRHQPWSRLVRRSEQSGQMEGYKPPREDLNAPDLYIPVMSFVTYILVVGIQLGLKASNQKVVDAVAGKAFSPDVLAGTGTTAFFVILCEVLFIKLGCYLLNVTSDAGFLDLIAYCGYKFIGIITTYIAKIFLPTWAVWSVFAYVMMCLGFFTLRTLKYIVLPESINPVVHPMRKRRINFLFIVALVQILLSWLLISVM